MTCDIKGYLQGHRCIVVDKNAMPFLNGITKIDLIVYDPNTNAMVGVSIREKKAGRKDELAEWEHKDRAYFRRATKRWCEKNGWYGKYRADAMFLMPNGEIDHVIGPEYTRVKKDTRNDMPC